MNRRTYFLVNDTRYDNHHGCLTVVRNLHAAMMSRGWSCTGSLPVSSSARNLQVRRGALEAADLIIVNGEGSLHHNSRNANRIFDICNALQKSHPLALVNAVWQDNDALKWEPLLANFKAIYARDRRSQKQLADIVPSVGYAPDLTFYDYPRFPNQQRSEYLCTDSVINSWTDKILDVVNSDDDIDICTMFTGRMDYLRGPKDWHKYIKYKIYPCLWGKLQSKVPPRYKTMKYAEHNTVELLRKFSTYNAVCVARYHALCFAIQQRIPFLAVASNSHKSESLLEDLGLPLDKYLIRPNELGNLKERLADIVLTHSSYNQQIETFNIQAKKLIDDMFRHVTE